MVTDKTILVIDTDTETIQEIMSALESEGYLVFIALDKDVSIKMANEVTPSIIFVNIGMSGTSGLEICKAIHDTKTLKDVPIVIITPHDVVIDARYTTMYGIVDLLKKPFNSETIIAKVRNVLLKIGKQPIIEEIGTEPLEEKITAYPVEEDIEVKLFEKKKAPVEEIAGKGKKPEIREGKIPDIQEEVIEEIGSDETELRKMFEEADKEEEKVQISQEETVEAPYTTSSIKRRDSLYRLSRRDKGKKSLVLFVVLFLLILGGGGFFVYKSLMKETKVQTQVAVKQTKPVEQPVAEVEPAKVAPAQEQQESLLKVEQTKPARPVEPVVPPEPAPVPKTVTKPAYYVQIGAYKNEANAVALAEQYKGKGYDAFTRKSMTKDKGTVYRVFIGNFKDKKKAAELAKNIRDKERISVFIFRE